MKDSPNLVGLMMSVLMTVGTAASLTPRDSVALSTPFPFDTSLEIPWEGAGVTTWYRLARYDDTISFYMQGAPASCPGIWYGDFSLVRLPLDYGDTWLVEQGDPVGCSPTSPRVHIEDVEYAFAIDTVLLYMRVLSSDSPSVSVRIDTARHVPLLKNQLPAVDSLSLGEPFHWLPVDLIPVWVWDTTQGGCPGELEGRLHDTAFYQPAFDLVGPWPASSYSSGVFPYLPLERFAVELRKHPADSSRPLLVRSLDTNCIPGPYVLRSSGVEYEVPFGALGSVYINFTAVSGSILRLEYDTVSWLQSNVVQPDIRWQEVVDAGVSWVSRNAAVALLPSGFGEPGAVVKVVVMDLAGKTLLRDTERIRSDRRVSVRVPAESPQTLVFLVQVKGRDPLCFIVPGRP